MPISTRQSAKSPVATPTPGGRGGRGHNTGGHEETTGGRGTFSTPLKHKRRRGKRKNKRQEDAGDDMSEDSPPETPQSTVSSVSNADHGDEEAVEEEQDAAAEEQKGEGDEASAATEAAQNRASATIERRRTAFFNLRVELPDSKKPFDTLKGKCAKIMTTLKETEGTVILCVYATNNFDSAITHADQLPETLANLRKYFHQIYPLAKGGFTWPSVRLGFDCETRALAKDIVDPLGAIDVNAYVKKLQKGETTKPYWLQFLSPDVDLPFWEEWFTKEMHGHALTQGAAADSPEANIEIGLIAHPINDGLKKKYGPASSAYAYNIEKNVGVHVVLETKFVENGGKYLRDSLKSEDFRLNYGMEVHLCPVISRDQSNKTKEKIRQFAEKHRLYMYNMTSRTREGISTLDTTAPSLNFSLRQLTMMEQNSSGEALFMSVGRSYNRNEEDGSIRFIFPKAWEDEAVHRMKGLGQYLVQKYGENVKQYFTLEERQKIEHSQIDANGNVIFWEDELLMVGEDEGDTPEWVVDKLPTDFERPQDTANEITRPVPPVATPPPYRATGDNDSLGTWGSGIHQAAAESNTSSSVSGRSTYSSVTIESRMSTLEQSVTSQASAVKAIQETLGELSTYLRDLRNSATQPSTTEPGSLPPLQEDASPDNTSGDAQG